MIHWLRKDSNLLLLLILVAAAVLRIFDWPHMGYHHDELSALLRTRFTSFQELIESGIRIDGHPAGVQLFLWGWTALGGYGSFWVKLPFILAGTASVFLIFKIGKQLFGESEGLCAAALLASLQYGILYSQWARPYAFGLFFVLLFAYGVVRIRTKVDARSALMLIVGAAAAGYTHYFALLQVVWITILVLPFLKRKSLIALGLSAGGAFLLWLPHLGITLDQLAIGGIGDWLQKPSSDFWIELLDFSFHYSWWLKGFLLLALMATTAIALDVWKEKWLERILLALSVVGPFAIGYWYSHEVSALLHKGTTFFMFPFLLLLVTSWFRWNRWMLQAVVPLTLLVSILTLALEREHYHMNYRTEYQTSLEWLSVLNEGQSESLPALIDLRADMVEFVFENNIVPESEIQFAWPLWDQQRFSHYLDSIPGDQLFVTINAGSKPEYLAAALDRFPCMEEAVYFSSGASYLLSRDCSSLSKLPELDVVENELLTSDNPYSHRLSGNWSSLSRSGENICFRAKWIGTPEARISLVFELAPGTESAQWRAVSTDGFLSDHPGNQATYHVIYAAETEANPLDEWRAFVWLENDVPARLQYLEVRSFPSNPLKYKLFDATDPARP